jgi:endonuclease YncB( thermonuclease family)
MRGLRRITACATLALGLLATSAQKADSKAKVDAEWVELDRVVDGDTIRVRRHDRSESLRLISVDTEERLGPGHPASATKPQTVFGEETALWAEKLFAGLGKDGARPKVGLVFPGGVEKRDAYDRLLCHVLLPDGSDYNLMLVKLGKSPYFNKYGNDPIDDPAFSAAQRSARQEKLGIWDPATNAPKTPGAPSAKRPYPELIAWWNARSIAVESWRKRSAAVPASVDAEDPDALERAALSGEEVDVFGELERIFEETNGDRTVLFRHGEKRPALRVVIPEAAREAYRTLDLDLATREFRQNYVWVHGRICRGARGYEMRSGGPDLWRRAGPEPALPPPPRAKEANATAPPRVK